MTEIEQLLTTMSRLRNKQTGCPWDLKQTFESLAPFAIEEAFEVVDAIATGDRTAIKEELGDLLLQVVFQSQLASEENAFTFADVAAAINAKMIRRHPHVFGDTQYANLAEQQKAWEAIKRGERGENTEPASVFDGLRSGFPALTHALKLQERAARVGFDWDRAAPVLAKVAEELGEVEELMSTETPTQGSTQHQRLTEELGDLLFACTNLARHLRIDSDLALRKANQKFETRFRWIERYLADRGQQPDELSLEALEALWQQAKRAKESIR